MTYEIRWTQTAFKRLQKLDHVAQKRIIEKLDEAASDPFAVSRKLGRVDLYSIRVEEYRIIVGIERERMLVMAIDLGHRSKIYKKL